MHLTHRLGKVTEGKCARTARSGRTHAGGTVHRKTVRRATVVLALTPLVSLPATAALAGGLGGGTLGGGHTTITTPAPDGDASAVAAEVAGVVAAGKTHA